MRVVRFQVDIVDLRVICGVSAVFTHIDLVPPLFVGKVEGHAMHLLAMGLQGTSLCESFITHLTFVGANSWKTQT